MEERERFNIIKKLILDYEKGILNSATTINKINAIATSKIDEYCLNNYWTSESLNHLVKRISIDPFKDWETIDDIEALKLIKEIIKNFSDEGILRKNSEALEKRFRKSEGTLIQLICHSELNSPEEILSELKKDSVIRL